MSELEKIVDNLLAITKVLERPIDPQNGIEINVKMNDLINVASLSADCVARSKTLMLLRIAAAQEKMMTQPNPPTGNTLRDLGKAKASVETGLFTKCDEINKYMKEAISSLRSSLSLYKEELHNNLQQQ